MPLSSITPESHHTELINSSSFSITTRHHTGACTEPLGLHGGSVSAEQTSQSSGFWFMILKIRGTSSLVNADDVVDPKTQARLSGDHLVNADDVVDTKTQAKLAPPHSPTPRLGRMVMLVPCLNSSFEFILVSGFRCEIRTPSLAFLL